MSRFSLAEILDRVQGRLIVSCQALPNEPLHGSEYMARMAAAAEAGGSAAIRANGPADIAAIRNNVSLPIIGLSTPRHTVTDGVKLSTRGVERTVRYIMITFTGSFTVELDSLPPAFMDKLMASIQAPDVKVEIGGDLPKKPELPKSWDDFRQLRRMWSHSTGP